MRPRVGVNEAERWFASSGEEWTVQVTDEKKDLVLAAITGDNKSDSWQLSAVSFHTNGSVGSMILDTGSSATVVNETLVR